MLLRNGMLNNNLHENKINAFLIYFAYHHSCPTLFSSISIPTQPFYLHSSNPVLLCLYSEGVRPPITPIKSTKHGIIKLRQDQTPLPCINSGQGIPPWGIGSKEPAYMSGIGPGFTARGPTKEQVTRLSPMCRGLMLVPCNLPSSPYRVCEQNFCKK